ncbi:MAG TPA: ABC transporter permease [Anaerolineae bacterium]
MRKLWLIAKHEYLKVVRKRSFLLGTLAMPLFFSVIIAIGILTAIGTDRRPVGYVDHAGVLRAPAPTTDEQGNSLIPMRAFADEASARAALAAKEIQVYYVLPPDYLETRTVTRYYWEDEPSEQARRDFQYFIRSNLATDLPADVRQRLLEGITVTLRSADGRQEVSGDGFVNFLLPFGVGLLFTISVMGAASYLMQAVADEKESRTVEIMATSLTPEQLIGGKAIGLIAVGLAQLIILLAVVVAGLAIGAHYLEALRAVRLPWSFVLVIAIYFLPAYVLMAGVMIAIGSVVTEVRQGQQVAGIVSVLFSVPYFFIAIFFGDPNSPIATFLTLFPTTSFVTVTLRWGVTVIPVWQLIAGWLLLAGSAVVSIWAAARIFRFGMLQYGQRLRFKEMLAAVRGRA